MTSNDYVDISTVVAKIKKEFLYGSIDEDENKVFLTLKSLADKYNVSYNTLVKNYSTPEKWGAEKKDVRVKIDQKIKEKKSEREAEMLVQIDSEYESAFSKLRKLTVDTIAKKKAGKVKGIDLFHYSNTLLNCYEGEKVAHGESLEDNTQSGWNALIEALKEPPDEKTKED